MKKATRRVMVRWMQEMIGFTVFAHWEGGCYKHTAWTRGGALEWARCYPASAMVNVYSIGGQLHARRGG